MGFCVSDPRLAALLRSECFSLSPSPSQPKSSTPPPKDSFALVSPEPAKRTLEPPPFTNIAGPFQQLVVYARDIRNDPESRSNAIWNLLEEAPRQFSQMIASLATDPQPLVRARVALHLNHVEKKEQEEIAWKLKEDSSPEVRAFLARSLRAIGAPWTLPLLVALAKDENKKVSREADRALSKTKIKAWASLPNSLRTREMKLWMMDRYLSGDPHWKSQGHDILVAWGMLDETIPTQVIAKYGDPSDTGLTVETVRQKVERRLGGQDLSGLSGKELFALYKILEEVDRGHLTDIIQRKFSGTSEPYADLKKLVAFSPYLSRLLKGLESRGTGSFVVSRTNPGEFRITFQIGSLAYLDLGRYRSSPAEERSPQLVASRGTQVAL